MMDGFIQCSSDPGQPGRAMDKKKLINSTILFCLDMKEVVEKNAEFENSDNLKELSKSQCPLSLLKVLLATDPIFLGNLEDKKLMRQIQSLKIVTILMKEVNPSV